jgi:hypothetical protein
MTRNPFEFGRALGPEELVDRQAEVDTVTAALLGASKVFLIGPRRYGKTSILRAAADRAERSGAIVLRYDAEAFPTLNLLAERLLADAVRRLTPTIEKAGTALRDLFARLRPEASVDPRTGGWSVTLATAEGQKPVPLLVDVLDGVERLAAGVEQPVAVVLDEFQKVVEDGGREAEAQIRAAIQHHHAVAYVFAGSKTRLLSDMTSDPNRPFYKLGEVRFIGPVPRDDFVEFVARGFAAGGIRVEPGAADAILDAAEEVPYNVQLLAHACWEACRSVAFTLEVDGQPDTRSVGQPVLTVRFVHQTRDAVALRSDPIYTQLWSALPSTQQRALLALLRERGEGLASTAVARRYDMPIATLSKSLKLLETKGILREEQARGATRLRLEDPLFGAWIGLVVPT